MNCFIHFFNHPIFDPKKIMKQHMINKNNHTLIPVLKNYIFAGEPFVD